LEWRKFIFDALFFESCCPFCDKLEAYGMEIALAQAPTLSAESRRETKHLTSFG